MTDDANLPDRVWLSTIVGLTELRDRDGRPPHGAIVVVGGGALAPLGTPDNNYIGVYAVP